MITGTLIGGFFGFGIWLIGMRSVSFKRFNTLTSLQLRWAYGAPALATVVLGALRMPLVVLVLSVGIFVFVGMQLDNHFAKQRVAAAKLEDSLMLPNLIDLLSVAITAGLSPAAALETAIMQADETIQRNWELLQRDSQELNFSFRLSQVARTNSGYASGRLAEQILISLERGTPILPMLDAIATDIRSTNYRNLNEKAAAKDVWMMLPVVFGILPAVTAVAIYPALTTLSTI
ncbi:MAG: hypothetical protein RL038_327 [Actinomycetota bacterium]|jgi:tight adherence protein C